MLPINLLPQTDPAPGFERVKANQTLADQALTKLNCMFDQKSVNASREKGGVGFVTGSISEQDTRIFEGLLVFALRETLCSLPDSRFTMHQQKPLIPVRANTAGIGEESWSEADFIRAIQIVGIAAITSDEAVGREPVAGRPLVTVIADGGFRLTNTSGFGIPPMVPVFWTPRATPDNPSGRVNAIRGFNNGTPLLSIAPFDASKHTFTREVLLDCRANRTANKHMAPSGSGNSKKRFASEYDEAFYQYCFVKAADSVLSTIVMVAAALGKKTPHEAFQHALSNESAEPFKSLFDTLKGLLTDADSNVHKVHMAYIAPNTMDDFIMGSRTDKNITDSSSAYESIYALVKTFGKLQVNGGQLIAQATRRFDDYYRTRILGFFPHGSQPGSTSSFILKKRYD